MTNKPNAVRAYLAKIGRKGGKATGPRKKRAARRAAKLRWKAYRAARRAKQSKRFAIACEVAERDKSRRKSLVDCHREASKRTLQAIELDVATRALNAALASRRKRRSRRLRGVDPVASKKFARHAEKIANEVAESITAQLDWHKSRR